MNRFLLVLILIATVGCGEAHRVAVIEFNAEHFSITCTNVAFDKEKKTIDCWALSDDGRSVSHYRFDKVR